MTSQALDLDIFRLIRIFKIMLTIIITVIMSPPSCHEIFFQQGCKQKLITLDLSLPPKVCCIKVVSCSLASTFLSPPSLSKHIDCIDVTRSLHKNRIGRIIKLEMKGREASFLSLIDIAGSFLYVKVSFQD